MPDAAAKIYIDLTDVVFHAVWHPTCGGIPRVQIEVANALLRANPNAVPFSLYNRSWRDLSAEIKEAGGDTDRFFANLHRDSAYLRERPRWHDPRHLALLAKGYIAAFAARCLSRVPRMRRGDKLYVGGAFWMSPQIIALCERAVRDEVALIVLFHDLIPIVHPHYTGHDFAAQYEAVLRLPAHFVVTTPFNSRELESVREKLCGANAKTCVSIVSLADEFPGASRNEQALSVPKRLLQLTRQPFVLCVGTIEIRKNHLLLLSVWDALHHELGDHLPTLVVAGRRGWKAEAALEKLDHLAPESGIVFVEAPADDELRWLYSACLFTVFPSLFEGWGLPVGESFWFGKGCAASNASSVPIVGRDLCVYFSPQGPEEMKAAIRRLLEPQTRKDYESRIAAAPLRRWAEVARDIEGVILGRSTLEDSEGVHRLDVKSTDGKAGTQK